MSKALLGRIDKLIKEAQKAMDQGQRVIFALHSLKVDIEFCKQGGKDDTASTDNRQNSSGNPCSPNDCGSICRLGNIDSKQK